MSAAQAAQKHQRACGLGAPCGDFGRAPVQHGAAVPGGDARPLDPFAPPAVGLAALEGGDLAVDPRPFIGGVLRHLKCRG